MNYVRTLHSRKHKKPCTMFRRCGSCCTKNHDDKNGPMQELKSQGLGHLRGLCGSLATSGTGGKHPQNIKRDMLRKLSAKNPESKVPRQNVCLFFLVVGMAKHNWSSLIFVHNSWWGASPTCTSSSMGVGWRWELLCWTKACKLTVSQSNAQQHKQQQPARNMPVLLPDILFPWMMQRGIWPEITPESAQQYWRHLSDVGSELGSMSDGSHLPIYLWGDGAQYTESGESMLVFCCGIVIDPQRSNIFPLFMCKEVTSLIMLFSHA